MKYLLAVSISASRQAGTASKNIMSGIGEGCQLKCLILEMFETGLISNQTKA